MLTWQDPSRRLTLGDTMAHPWLSAGGGAPSLPQQGQEQLQNGAGTPAGHVPAANFAQAAQAARPEPGPAERHGSSMLAQRQEEASTEGSEALDGPDGEAAGTDEAQQRERRDRLLRASLMGLVSGDLPVLTFAAGEALLSRGQPGKRAGLAGAAAGERSRRSEAAAPKRWRWAAACLYSGARFVEHCVLPHAAGSHMYYIIDGECEVLYRPTATQPADACAGSAPGRPSSVGSAPGRPWSAGSASVEPSPRPAGAAHRPPHPPSQQQQRQQQLAAQAVESGGQPPVASQPSAAGLFSALPSCTSEPTELAVEAWPAAQPDGTASAAPAGMLCEDSGLSSSSTQLEASGQGGLCTRRTSTCIAEAAEGAEHDMAAAGPLAAGAPQGRQPPPEQAGERASSGRVVLRDSGEFGVPSPAPTPAVVRQHRPPAPPPGLAIPLSNEPSTPVMATELASASSAAGTPIPGSPVRGVSALAAAAGSGAAAASAAPSPGPFGLRRQMGVDMEGAGAELLSPSQPPRSGVAAGAPAWLQDSDGPLPGKEQAQQAQPLHSAGAAGVGEQAQQAQQAQHPLPQVEGEELPPSLIQASHATPALPPHLP